MTVLKTLVHFYSALYSANDLFASRVIHHVDHMTPADHVTVFFT